LKLGIAKEDEKKVDGNERKRSRKEGTKIKRERMVATLLFWF
jgi:hypothetical protein